VSTDAPTAVTISVLSAIPSPRAGSTRADRENVARSRSCATRRARSPRAERPRGRSRDWADVEGRTAAQVVEAFNKAIANTMPALSRRAVVGT
jgi:hypothetical protein